MGEVGNRCLEANSLEVALGGSSLQVPGSGQIQPHGSERRLQILAVGVRDGHGLLLDGGDQVQGLGVPVKEVYGAGVGSFIISTGSGLLLRVISG